MNKKLYVAGGIAAAVVAVIYVIHNITGRGMYPPHDDQLENLRQAKVFAEHFVVYWRDPLYVGWLGTVYALSGANPEMTFYADKIIAILMLAAIVGWLGYRLWGWPAAIVMSTWALNSNPLFGTPTNSNSMAAVLFAASLIPLTLRTTERLPYALLALLLATKVRQEMWVVFGAAVVLVVFWRIRRTRIGSPRHWLIAATIAVAVLGLLRWRHGPPFLNRAPVAFAQTFAFNYVERHDLGARYPEPWTNYYRVLRENLPALTPYPHMTPQSALKNYPKEFRDHVLQNMRRAVRTIGALFASLNHPLIVLAIAVLCTLYAWRRPDSLKRGTWASFDSGRRTLLLAWASLAFLIVPLLLVYFVGPRYVMPLLPAGIVWGVSLWQSFLRSHSPSTSLRMSEWTSATFERFRSQM